MIYVYDNAVPWSAVVVESVAVDQYDMIYILRFFWIASLTL